MSLLSRLAVQAARAYGILSSKSTNVSADYLVVAGGGSGGTIGGGGAGGYRTSTATLSTLNTYSITVGAGGAALTSAQGNNGSDSSISGTGLTTITSTGGGGGGAESSTSVNNGKNGGSGGGAATSWSGVSTPGTPGNGNTPSTSPSQGNNGGSSVIATSTTANGGGGGGAGAVGGNGTGSSTSGSGGAGSASSISGSSVTYAGGGGAGAYLFGGTGTAGTGGSGGGGNGGRNGLNPTAGTANTGGGGGGAGLSSAGAVNTAVAGGSGIVIISYTSATPLFIGGTITTSAGKQIHTFTSSGTLSPITPITASYLVVAGGGGAAQGGGGAGGLLTSSTTLYSGATYVVTVGAGGTGGPPTTIGSQTNGSDSILSGTGLTTLTATGGGYGGRTGGGNGNTGGSGGGGAYATNGGAGTSGQGFAGGNGGGASSAGGGGGSSAVGSAGSGSTGGNGGAGTASSITGTSVTYAGGGGGAANTTAGSGGAGGGGSGGVSTTNGGAGTPNLGGGGGGGGATSSTGGNGGSGTVIISYAGSQVFNGGLVTTSGGNTIHTFTSTGALTPLTNNLNNSLRFRSSASAYLSRTPTVAGNRKTWTLSYWTKRGALSVASVPFHAGSTGSEFAITWRGFDAWDFYEQTSSVQSAGATTNAVYRDPSAWYHIVFAYDTTQATAANRWKIYINGNQVTSFSATQYPTQNSDGYVNSTVPHYFGIRSGTTTPFDGYMTDINFIDGQALEPYYFGNNDANGVWKPIQYKGTYGTNGFYLTFGNTTSTTTLGYDSSPNGNNWTCNNISLTAGTTYDAMKDVPTNTSATVANFPTLNPLSNGGATISNANLTTTANGATHYITNATFQMPTSGKYYWEITTTTLGSTARIATGLLPNGTALSGYPWGNANTYGWYYGDASNNIYWCSNTTQPFNIAGAVNDVLQICYDADNGTVYAGKNNVFYNSSGATTGSPSTLTNPTSTGVTATNAYFPATSVFTAGAFAINFGQRPFTYTPPTGYVALNTYNLPTPTILQGNKYMDATLYTGNGAGQTIVNAGQFYPDLIWVKSRSNATNNNLFTSVLSGANILKSNSTDGVVGVTNAVTAFNSNGFTLGSDSGSIGVNINSNTYVAWQWLAGATTGTTTNTNGSITSYINVNTTAGFSQVYWTGTAANGTLGHGLGVAPKMIITKCRGSSTDWAVWHTSIANTQYLVLNSTAAVATGATYWNSTSPTSSVFSVGSSNPTNAATAMVAYCWAEIAGFSKFGSYVGNYNVDGVFVYCGFRPKFILIKAANNLYDWELIDTSRSTYNSSSNYLQPNLSSAEYSTTSDNIDILSNGFKMRNNWTRLNDTVTYIYAAFAENPFKNANAR